MHLAQVPRTYLPLTMRRVSGSGIAGGVGGGESGWLFEVRLKEGRRTGGGTGDGARLVGSKAEALVSASLRVAMDGMENGQRARRAKFTSGSSKRKLFLLCSAVS